MLVYSYGSTPSSANLLEQRCMETKVYIGSSPTSNLYAENSFGNIYVNKITAKGGFPGEIDTVNNKILYNKILPGGTASLNIQSTINLSTPSQILLQNYTASAKNPKNYDPMFLYFFGPKFVRSDTFQQLQVK